jgi:integrase
MANPLSVVRGPRSTPRDAARPLAPAVVERIRAAMLNPPDREISASTLGHRARRRYTLPAPGTPQTRQRDALIVSILAYAGLRPGELRALQWEGFRENTILVRRAANPDGSSKPTKNRQHRTVRLLAVLAQDIREHKLAIGRPSRDDADPARRRRHAVGQERVADVARRPLDAGVPRGGTRSHPAPI